MPRLKFITMCGAIRSLEILFLDFAARKRKVFSRPDNISVENNTWVLGNTRCISSVEHDISRVSAANE